MLSYSFNSKGDLTYLTFGKTGTATPGAPTPGAGSFTSKPDASTCLLYAPSLSKQHRYLEKWKELAFSIERHLRIHGIRKRGRR